MADDPLFERLVPGGPPASAEELAAELRADRPALFVNMVATVDGRATVGGRSGPIGGEADRALFHALRTVCDAVLAGTGTVRAEHYGRLVRNPDLRARREEAGLEVDPIFVLISRSGEVPWSAPVFHAPGQTVVIYTGRTGVQVDPADLPATARAQVELSIVELEDPSPARVLEHLRANFAVESVLCEGGPRLNRALLEDHVVDDLFLTLGALVAGGDHEKPVVEGPPLPAPVDARPVWVLRSGHELFLRYAIGDR